MRIKTVVITLFAVAVFSLTACGQLAEQANSDGNSAYIAQNYDAALSAYQTARSRAPGLAEPRYNLGNAYYNRAEYDDAVEQYQDALIIADENLSQIGLFNLGNAYFQQRDFPNAIEAYKEILRLDPNNADARHNLELAMRQLAGESSVADQKPQDTDQDSNQPQDTQSEGQQHQEEVDDIQDAPNQEQSQQNQQGQTSQEDDTGQSDVPQLTEDQAKQLLDAIGRSTETLRGHLSQVFVVSGDSPSQDW